MENIENNENKRVEETVDNTDYIAAIKELKQNSVDKAKYDALRQENKKLINALVDGGDVDMDEKVKDDDTIDSLRKDLFSEGADLNNLDYVSKALKLREKLLARGDEDPFVPQGTLVSATQADYDRAKKVAEILQEMVDEAEGDPNVFLNEYQRRVKDTSIKK